MTKMTTAAPPAFIEDERLGWTVNPSINGERIRPAVSMLGPQQAWWQQ